MEPQKKPIPKKKKRQQVRRHFKPSLGRWVENYDRRGEHAKAKAPRGRPDPTAEHDATGPAGDEPAPAPPRRRVLIGGVLLGAVLAILGATRLLTPAGPREFEVHAARKPLLVTIDQQPSSRVVTASSAERETFTRASIESALEAARRHPDRLIVLELKAPVISYNSLEAADQIQLEGRFGPQAAASYEQAVASFLGRILDATGTERVAVLGLPVEPGEAGAEAARRTNRRYRPVLNRVEHLVSGHLFFHNASTLDEQDMIEQGIPEALALRGDRPVVFRHNVTWRALVSKGGLDAAVRMRVVAEAR